jgi:ketosteroid isomerase-like protein
VPADGAEIVRELFAAVSRRDPEAVVALVDTDGEFWPVGTAEQTGRSEPYRGHAGIREYFADIAAVWEQFVLEPGELRVAGDGVVSFGTVTVRAVGTSETAEISVIWVFKLRDGKVLSCRVVKTAAEAHVALRSGEAADG